jgi:hypothetical protein
MLGYCPVVVLLKVTFTPPHCLSSEKMKDRLAVVSLTYKSANIVV